MTHSSLRSNHIVILPSIDNEDLYLYYDLKKIHHNYKLKNNFTSFSLKNFSKKIQIYFHFLNNYFYIMDY